MDFVVWFFTMALGVAAGVLLAELALRALDRRNERRQQEVVAHIQDPEPVERDNAPEWMRSRGRSYDPRRKPT